MRRIALAIAAVTLAAAAQAQGNPDRNAYFGQTHSHTSWSIDAYIFGNHLTGPAEAYQYSMGQPVKHPAGFEVKLKRPLDFHGVTESSAGPSGSSITGMKRPFANSARDETDSLWRSKLFGVNTTRGLRACRTIWRRRSFDSERTIAEIWT